jgi:hypothetical protein
MGTRGLVLVNVKKRMLLVLHSPMQQLSLPQGKWVVSQVQDSPQLELGECMTWHLSDIPGGGFIKVEAGLLG